MTEFIILVVYLSVVATLIQLNPDGVNERAWLAYVMVVTTILPIVVLYLLAFALPQFP